MPFVFKRLALKILFLLLSEEILDLVVGNDTLLEHVGTGLIRFDHLDALGEVLTRAGFQCCDYFLCHGALKLFDFTVKGDAFEERVVLAAFQTVGGVLLVLGGDVTRHAGYTALFLFGAFEDDLNSVAFLSHCDGWFLVNFFGCGSLAQSHVQTFLVDGFHAGGRHFERDPAALLLRPEALGFQIGTEFALGLVVRVGDVVAHHRYLACDFANFHLSLFFGLFPHKTGCKYTTFSGKGKKWNAQFKIRNAQFFTLRVVPTIFCHSKLDPDGRHPT